MSVRSSSTVTVSPTPNVPVNEIVYWAALPSSPAADPAIDHSAGVPGDASIIVVVADAAVLSTLTATPVVEVALERSSEKSSGPSINESAVIATSMTRSVITAPSDGAV